MNDRNRCTCEEAFRRLDAYVDRELTPDEISTVTEHLEECEGCAREFDFEESVLTELREKINQVALPPNLRERVLSRLRSSPTSPEP